MFTNQKFYFVTYFDKILYFLCHIVVGGFHFAFRLNPFVLAFFAKMQANH